MKRIFILIACFLLACSPSSSKKNKVKEAKIEISTVDKELHEEAKSTFGILEKPEGLEIYKVELGKKLYLEKKLSKSGTISCNSCHRLDTFGVDNQATSPGHDGTRGDRNSPTSFNAHLNIAQFWDGRAKDLKEQALGPLLNPIEHGLASQEEVLKILDTKEYKDLFKKAYKSEKALTFDNVGDSIAEFEKTLVTPGRFDDYLRGDIHALTSIERRGLKKFIEVGCTTCHYGATLGGQDYHKFGLVKEYPTKDLGRFKVTKDEEDKHSFKVPNLRNIEKTNPYFHDGHIDDLGQAVKIMARHQLGEELKNEEVDDIVAFLKSLTGKL